MKIGFVHFLTTNSEAIHQIKEVFEKELELDKIICVRCENQVEGKQYPYLEIREI